MSGRAGPGGQDPVVSRETRRRVVAASFIGNFVEWFDYAVYGYLAATIGAVFFPESNPQTALLLTFALFAISFLVRPLGGFVWGHIGDRVGRRTWRAVHWVAYAGWPLAFVHGLGAGSDSFSVWLLPVEAACLIAVVAALAWRVRAQRLGRNLGAVVAGTRVAPAPFADEPRIVHRGGR